MSTSTVSANSTAGKPDMKLFWACFIALVATSFVFGIRANTMLQLQADLGLSEAEKGNIGGAGMWPFGISIIFFSLVIDRIGYKTAAIFAMVCHSVSLLLTIQAKSYESFYLATLLISVANGTVEAFVNPVVATMFPREKAKWLNILHAGWPAGLALGAAASAIFSTQSWQFKYGLCLIPLVLYAILIIPRAFPVNERVKAGVSYRDMIKEVGGVGAFILAILLISAVIQLLQTAGLQGVNASWTVKFSIAAVIAVVVGLYTKSVGNWLFIFVLITIGPLATTELGTDGWMPDLLTLSAPAGMTMAQAGLFATCIFIYTSVIMTILRFYAGPIVHRFSPIGLLVIGAAIAIAGLMFLSNATGWVIIAAATVYALGKTFLWSTTLGMVSEQFPKGGALTLNGVSAVGVLFLGVFGSPLIGFKQDQDIDARLKSGNAALYEKVAGPEKQTLFGNAPSLDQAKIAALDEPSHKELEKVQAASKRGMFATIAFLPAFMLACYLIMWFYFKAKGGYKPVSLSHGDEAEPGF